MRVVIDIETNGLINPDQIWVIVCKDLDTGLVSIFREVTTNDQELERFLDYSTGVSCWIGHNILGYDLPILTRIINSKGKVLSLPKEFRFKVEDVIDTLIISKMADYSREGGHSIEQYGIEFGQPKGLFSDFSKYTLAMEEYCVRDVEICERVYGTYRKYISNPDYRDAILTEHQFQIIVNDLHDNGFAFDAPRATRLLGRVEKELQELDEEILKEFPPKLQLVREIHPKVTKHGTLNRTDFRFVKDGCLTDYNGGPFTHCSWTAFNPSSHKQIIDVLHNAGWEPVEKTDTHIEIERNVARTKWAREHIDAVQLQAWKDKLVHFEKYGWRVSEANLATLPVTAPKPARLLAKRIMIESRRRTLNEWLSLVAEDSRIHGKFYSIGAWTHRMAHQKPNTANIPTEAKLFGKEMRQLWIAPKNRLLVGVDAEGIQLRIFAHYINDEEFTDALVRGRKEDKTDPHSLNQRIMGSVCKSRAIAKRWIYALLLGAGLGKLAQILECSEAEASEVLDRIYRRYTGLKYLKEEVIPADAKRGWFIGIDGRPVRLPGDTTGTRKHLCMSGYLQNGETIVMRRAAIRFTPFLKDLNSFLVDFVHDEWQTECPNDFDICLQVAKIQADAIREVGEELNLRCPLAGSYWNDDHKDYTIGTNWYQTH